MHTFNKSVIKTSVIKKAEMAEIKREYYPTGQLKSVWSEINGMKEGEYKYYFRENCNSNKKDYIYICNYVNGIREDECAIYSMDGQLSEIGNYVNGKLEGEYKKYYENGQLEYVCNLINNCKEGECKGYYDNGQLKWISNYVNDNHDGLDIHYHDNGQISSIFSYVKGHKLEQKIYSYDGKLIQYWTNNKKQ